MSNHPLAQDRNAKNTDRVAERLTSAALSIADDDTSHAKREVTMALVFAGHITTHASQEHLRQALREPMQYAADQGVRSEHWQAVATELKSQASGREKERLGAVLAAVVTNTDNNALYKPEAGVADQSKHAGVLEHIKHIPGLEAHVIDDVSGLKDRLEAKLAALGMKPREGTVAFSVSTVKTPTSNLARPASALSHA